MENPAARPAEGFPFHGSRSEQLRHVLPFATRAPSIHNTQPWTFVVDGDRIEVYRDPSRWLKVADPTGREMAISIGAAIYHLKLALRAHLLHPEVVLLGESGNPDHVATVRVEDGAVPTSTELRMLAATEFRNTSRTDFEERPIARRILRALAETVEEEGASYISLDAHDQRITVAGKVAEADVILMASPEYRHELQEWIRPRRAGDGVPKDQLGLTGVAALLGGWIVGHVDSGEARAMRDVRHIADAPAVGMIATDQDGVLDWLKTGMGLAHLALAAAVEGVRLGIYSQPLQIPEHRSELRSLTGHHQHPQMLFRMGYSSGGSVTARRDVEDVLVEHVRRDAAPDFDPNKAVRAGSHL